LILMFKAPHRSKRRLAQQIGVALATRAAAHLCDCALEDMSQWSGPVCFAPAAEPDDSWLQSHVGSPVSTLVQQEGNLGERINFINDSLWAQALQRQIFIGIDCPQLHNDYLQGASKALDQHDVVLGPATDGGVVLMGARCLWPRLHRLAWSRSTLMAELKLVCEANGLAVSTLEPLADVDTVDDFQALAPHLSSDARPARRQFSHWLTTTAEEFEALA